MIPVQRVPRMRTEYIVQQRRLGTWTWLGRFSSIQLELFVNALKPGSTIRVQTVHFWNGKVF